MDPQLVALIATLAKAFREYRLSRLRIVTVGGGTGQTQMIKALCILKELGLPIEISAIVTTLDNGGSTRMFRTSRGMLAIGDLMKCVLAATPFYFDELVELFGWRFKKFGPLGGHSAQNFVFAIALEQLGTSQAAIDRVSKAFRALARILPVTLFANANIWGEFDGHVIEGQREIGAALLKGRYRELNAIGIEPIPTPNRDALKAIRNAHIKFIAPGSQIDSLSINFCVPSVLEAWRDGVDALRVDVANHTVMLPDESLEDFMDAFRFGGLKPEDFDAIVVNTERMPVPIQAQYRADGMVPMNWRKRGKYASHRIVEGGLLGRPRRPDPDDPTGRTLIVYNEEKLAWVILRGIIAPEMQKLIAAAREKERPDDLPQAAEK